MSSYRRALSDYSELDIPHWVAQVELSLTVVSEMGGELQAAARGYARLADDERLSDRERARCLCPFRNRGLLCSRYTGWNTNKLTVRNGGRSCRDQV